MAKVVTAKKARNTISFFASVSSAMVDLIHLSSQISDLSFRQTELIEVPNKIIVELGDGKIGTIFVPPMSKT